MRLGEKRIAAPADEGQPGASDTLHRRVVEIVGKG